MSNFFVIFDCLVLDLSRISNYLYLLLIHLKNLLSECDIVFCRGIMDDEKELGVFGLSGVIYEPISLPLK